MKTLTIQLTDDQWNQIKAFWDDWCNESAALYAAYCFREAVIRAGYMKDNEHQEILEGGE